jgi:hypothetical protein
MKLKKIAIALLCTVLLTSCAAEIAEPLVGDGVLDVPYDSGTPPTEGNEQDENDNEFPSLEGWQTQSDGVVDEIEPEIIDEPAPQPVSVRYTLPEGETEISVQRDRYRFSLISDYETELTIKLEEIANRIRIFLPPDDTIEIFWTVIANFYDDYIEAGLIEQVEQWYLSVENLDIIYNDIFSKEATNIIPIYSQSADENGLIELPPKCHGPYEQIVLKEQYIGENIIVLYFYYYIEDYARNVLRTEFNWTLHEETGGYFNDSPIVGRSEWCYATETAIHIFYTDMLPTLNTVKYTFIPEDGKYKILSIESVTT